VALGVVWIVWGSTYLAIRVVVREMPPLTAASLRFFVAGLLMSGIALFVDRSSGWPSRRQWIDYSVIGVLLLAVGNGFVMWAEKTVPSSTAALIVATVPVWILLLDGLRPGGQPWTARVWIGTAIGLAGVALVARPEAGVEAGHWPAILGLQVACLAWTVGSLYAQMTPRRLPLASAAAIEMLAGSLALAGLAWLFREDPSVVGAASPVVAVILGWLILDESLTPGLLAGGALIVLSVVLTTLRKPQAKS
jgi:drug/metabolite transporter (DMT)-like permease